MMNKSIIIVMMILLVHAVSAETIKVGNDAIEYDTLLEYGSMSSYYKDDVLVLSTFDNNGDGKADQWFMYGEGFVLQSAVQDSDNSGKPDYFVEYDAQGNVVSEREAIPFLQRVRNLISRFRFYVLGFIVLVLAAFFIFVLLKSRKKRKHKKAHDKHEAHGKHHKKEYKEKAD